MHLNRLLDARFDQVPSGDPEAVAISLAGEERWTYRRLRAGRNRFAGALLEAGVAPGDRVGMLGGNSLEYIALYLAELRVRFATPNSNLR